MSRLRGKKLRKPILALRGIIDMKLPFSMIPTTLKDTLDHLPGGLLITDTESRVLYASSALERRTGFSVAEIVGKKPGQLWGGKMKKKFYSTLWRTINTESQPFVGEVKNTRKNGAKNDEHIFIVPIRDSLGVPQFFAEVHPELSGRESELAFGKEFLDRASHMAQDRNFFAWVFQVLSKKKDGTVFAGVVPSWEAGFQNATSFLRESFIDPTDQKFLRRKEDALLVAAAQTDPEKFSGLYEKYAASVQEYFSRRLGGDRPLAEDLTQEVFARAFRYLPAFRMANASYYTYLLHVAHSVLVNYYRKREHPTVSLFQHAELVDEHTPVAHPVEDRLEALLAELSLVERSVMLMKYHDGLKVKEIAKKIEKTENAVKLVLSRTRKKLKNRLNKV